MKKVIFLLAVVSGLLLSMTSSLWAEVTKLRVACVVSPKSVYNAGMLKPWGEMIEKRTKAIGKPIQVTIFPGESVVKATEHYKALTNGTLDVDSMIGVHLVDDGDIAASVMNLPLLFKDTKSMALTALDLAAKYPEFMKPYTAKSKVLWFQPTGPSNILASVKKPIKTLEDVKGLKTRSAGLGISSDVVKALGSIPIDIQMPDIYEGLNNGLLDYMSKNWEAYMAFKWHEPTRYRTVLPRGLWSDFLVTAMNWDTWNKLSPDVQKIIDELSDRRQMTVEVAGKMDLEDQQLRGAILGIDKKSGKPDPYIMPEEEFNRWRKAVQPVYNKWTDMMEAKGLPGKRLLQDAMQLSDKYGK
jgi:TRAP-type C4-dicarboxylate transport system substrate-binding protein